MEFRQIRYFLEVRRRGSYVKAAGALGLTQPALSRQMSLLEREFGRPLFERDGRQMRLTADGETFLRQAVRMEDLFQETLDRMHEKTDELRGVYSLSTGGTLAAWVLPNALARIREAHPALSFRLVEGDASETKEALLRGNVDLGILTGPIKEAGLRQEPFLVDRIVPVVGIHHPLARRRRRVTVDDLRKEEFVMFHPASAIRRSVEQRIRSISAPAFRPSVSMELRSVESVIHTVEAGLGVGFLSELSLNPRLKALPVPELIAQRRFFFCYREHHRRGIPALLKALIEAAG